MNGDFSRGSLSLSQHANFWSQIEKGLCPFCNIKLIEIAVYENPNGLAVNHKLDGKDKVHFFGTEEFVKQFEILNMSTPVEVVAFD